MEVRKANYPWLKCHENEEKMYNDYYVLENDHRIKTTQPISLILVSFFSEDNVLSDEIKICYMFEYQSNENRAFRLFFFGGGGGGGHPAYFTPSMYTGSPLESETADFQ